MRRSLLAIMILCACSTAAFAAPPPLPEPQGQNAFTRAVQGPLSSIVTPVKNPNNEMCNGVVDCRKKRTDLKTVWQVNNTDQHKDKNFPAPCYVPKNGKYVYSANAC